LSRKRQKTETVSVENRCLLANQTSDLYQNESVRIMYWTVFIGSICS